MTQSRRPPTTRVSFVLTHVESPKAYQRLFLSALQPIYPFSWETAYVLRTGGIGLGAQLVSFIRQIIRLKAKKRLLQFLSIPSSIHQRSSSHPPIRISRRASSASSLGNEFRTSAVISRQKRRGMNEKYY